MIVNVGKGWHLINRLVTTVTIPCGGKMFVPCFATGVEIDLPPLGGAPESGTSEMQTLVLECGQPTQPVVVTIPFDPMNPANDTTKGHLKVEFIAYQR